jgi:hypothetical protein
MDLHTSTLRDALPDLSDISTISDSDGSGTETKDPTLLTFVMSEVGGVVSAAFNGYSTAFINNLFYAIIFAFACNYLWELPLPQVVDVSLAFFLFTTGLMIAFHIFFMARALANGEGYLGLYIAVIAVLTALLPFASVLGFTVYGWFVEGDWTTTSTVYQWYVGLFGSGYQWLETRTGDVLGLMVVETDAKGIDVTKVDTDLLVQWAQISAAAIAIIEFVLKRTTRTA